MNIKNLSGLSDKELTVNMKRLISNERNMKASFIAYLAEVIDRKLHIKLGYSSLMTYCMETFNLSEGSSYKRMQIARHIKKFPVILDYIFDNQLSMSAACLLCPHLTETNYNELLNMSKGKSKRAVEKIVRGLAPKEEPAESIRTYSNSNKKNNGNDNNTNNIEKIDNQNSFPGSASEKSSSIFDDINNNKGKENSFENSSANSASNQIKKEQTEILSDNNYAGPIIF